VNFSEDHDVIVIGAGAGGMTAACVAAAEGLATLLIEKADRVGGTTSVSGGMVWVPANAKMRAAGLTDSLEKARLYLSHTVPGDFNRELRETFLTRASEAIEYLEARTALALKPVTFYPDYYPDLPGATLGGRVLEPVPFDGRELGSHFGMLRPPLPEFMLFGGMIEENTNNAYWAPVSRFRRPDGTPAVYPHTITDRGKPGFIAVDRRGQRFTNEAVSYHEFVQAMFRARAIPAFLICDRADLWKYGLGAVKPFTVSLGAHTASGYLARGTSIRTLAEALGIDAAALEATVLRHNEDARAGVDRAFGKGGNAYGKYVGDPDHTPNPCMGPIEHGPFHAVALYPADLGTAAGLRTNVHAQVLDDADAPIAGLYACGNDMSSIMNGGYPGPGITLGPALTFGYIAGRHLARPERQTVKPGRSTE